MNIYLELTKKFNAGKCRAIISSGQAVVLHRLAVMSKDGDWIIREDAESAAHILGVLASYGARYRFGAPLDPRWLQGGWSSHFEFMKDGNRVRTDFVTRPPRLTNNEIENLWAVQESRTIPFVDLRDLAELKKTNREKDYPVIGELARRMERPEEQFLYSRSARDLKALSGRFPGLAGSLAERRPLLRTLNQGEETVEAALDAERRELMHRNEERLGIYIRAAENWKSHWPVLEKRTSALGLLESHCVIANAAECHLPMNVKGPA